MEEDPGTEGYLHEEITRQYYQRELRSLELIAYAELMSAVRASGALDEGKRNIINFVREAFCITDERHKAEIRRVASDERLGLIADMINGKNTSQEWTHEGYTPFPTLPHLVKYISDEPPDTLEHGCEKENEYMDETKIDGSEIPPGLLDGWPDEKGRVYYSEKPKADDFTELSIKSESESDSPSEDEIPAFRVIKRRGPIKRIVTSKIKIEVPTIDRGNPSPDITDAPKSAVKREISRPTSKRGRGAKRNITIGHRMPATSVPAKHNLQKSFQNSTRGKIVKQVSKPVPRSRSSSNDITDIPIKKTKPTEDEFSNNSVVVESRVGRGRGIGGMHRGRGLGSGRGGNGRGRGRGGNIGKRNSNKLCPAKIKIKLNRPLKSKIKKPVPISVGSRRKSKLKEKPIDDLFVEMTNYDDDDLRPNYIHSEINTAKSNTQDNNLYKKGESKFDSPSKDYKYDDTNNDVAFKSIRDDRDNSDKEDDVDLDDDKPINNNNEEVPRSQKEKESWANKSDSENSCSSFARRGVGRGTPPMTNSTSVASTAAEILSSESNSSSSSSSRSRSSIDDNEENENSSDNDGPEKIKACPNNSQTQNQQNSPTPLQSINSQQCPTPHREVAAPSPIQKLIRHKTPSAGVNPSPGVIIQQPRNPLPAPVFSTSLNLNSFNKKRTKMIGNSVVDSLNLHLPSANATSGVTTTVATASSLATRRPTIISAAGMGGGIYSNSPSLSPSGRTPGILHPTRKAHPHILSTSKAHRNFIPNSNSNNTSVNTNSVSISSSSQINTVTSISNCISSSTNSVQVQPNQNFTSSTAATISAVSSIQQSTNSSTTSVQSFATSSGSTLSVSNAIPIGPVGVARTQGTNIIFLQKAGSSGVTTNASANVLPVKNPRAVILRRAQIPCQGNVMILDVQKNQLVNASQAPQFLQTARILSATTTDLSSLNLPGNPTTRKIIQLPPSVGTTPPPTAITYPAAANVGAESPFRQPGLQTQINVQTPAVRKTRIFTQQSVVVTSAASNIVPSVPTVPTALRTTVNVESSNPSAIAPISSIILPAVTRIVPRKEPSLKIQPLVDLPANTKSGSVSCPIEAELMEMERNDFYEEEVVTSISDTNINEEPLPLREPIFPPREIAKPVSTYGLSNCTNKVAGTTNYQSLKSNSALDTGLRINCSVTNTPNTPLSTQSSSANIEGSSSTDTASENENSFTTLFSSAESQIAKHKPVVEISELYKDNPLMSSHVSVISSSNSSNSATAAILPDNVSVPFHAVEESIETTPIPEDIFEAALKSSGLNFHDNSFFDNDDISTNPILNDMDSHQDHEIASQVEVITISDSNSTE